jgi:hypothetical protein
VPEQPYDTKCGQLLLKAVAVLRGTEARLHGRGWQARALGKLVHHLDRAFMSQKAGRADVQGPSTAWTHVRHLTACS